MKDKNYNNKNLNRGFSIIEILIALFVFSVVTASVFLVSFGSQTTLMNLKLYEDLLSTSQIILERAKAEAILDFPALVSREEKKELNEILEVSFLYDYTKKIKSIAKIPNIDIREVELISLKSDWKNVLGGDTCFSVLNNPKDYKIIKTFPLGTFNTMTDIDVVRGKAYITFDSVNTPNFLIIDVENPKNPFFSSNNFSSGRKIAELHIVGKYAYLATKSTSRQLQVLNISNPTNPVLFLEFRLPSPSSTTTPSSIFYNNKKIYLGTEKHESGKEFFIIDVTNPENPVYQDSFKVDTKINSIAVKDNFSFIAVPNPTPLRMLSYGNSGIKMQDYFENQGLTQHGGQKVAINGGKLALGRSVQGLNPPENYHEIFLFDISHDNLELKTSKKIGLSVRDLLLRENVLIVIGALSNKNELQFLSLDENNLLELEYKIDLSEKPIAIDCENDVLYLLTGDDTHNNLVIIGKNE